MISKKFGAKFRVTPVSKVRRLGQSPSPRGSRAQVDDGAPVRGQRPTVVRGEVPTALSFFHLPICKGKGCRFLANIFANLRRFVF